MLTFAEIVNRIYTLTESEMCALRKLIEKKRIEFRQQEILEISEIARKESGHGETIVLSTQEEIKSYFST